MNPSIKTILAVAMTSAALSTAHAAPFIGYDARSAGMGGTGVASSKVAHATYFNPSLLANASDRDNFGVALPQIGAYFVDENDLIDGIDAFTESPVFDDFALTVDNLALTFNDIDADLAAIDAAAQIGDAAAVTAAQLQFNSHLSRLNTLGGTGGQLNTNIADLNLALTGISRRVMSGGIGGGGSIAIPSKTLAAALSVHTSAVFAGELIYTPEDSNTLVGYGAALGEFITTVNTYNTALTDLQAAPNATTLAALDTAKSDVNLFSSSPDGNGNILINNSLLDTTTSLTSNAHFTAAAITDFGFSLATRGNNLAVGVTPKIQLIEVYDYVFSLDQLNFSITDVVDAGEKFTAFNLDAGVSYRLGGGKYNIILGGVVKNVLGGEHVTKLGTVIKTSPQARVGAALSGKWFTLTADMDLTRNDPIAFERATRYVSLGSELDLKFLKLRLGYRADMVNSSEVFTAGIGLFNIINISAFADTLTTADMREAGVMIDLELSF